MSQTTSTNQHEEDDLKSLHQLLSSTCLVEIPGVNQQELCYFFNTDDIRDVFRSLIDNHILSAPIWDKQQQKWSGLVDMKDFVAYILYLFGRRKQEGNGNPTSPVIAEHSGQIVDFSKRNPFVQISSTSTVQELLKSFTDRGLHRMAVVSATDPNHVMAMVSQSTIVGWLVDNEQKLGRQIHNSVQQLGVGALGTIKKVIQLKKSSLLIDAFQLLRDQNLQGIAIVDDDGKFVGNISASDLQFCVDENLSFLSYPIEDLFDSHPYRKFIARGPIVCLPSWSLIEVMRLMVEARVHRIYVVDSMKNFRPIGVITMTDILDAITDLGKAHKTSS
jgi:CBS domain-containing protein